MRRIKFAVMVVALAGLAVGLGLYIARTMAPPPRVVQTYAKDAGFFYRFRAGFTVKATGEPLDFDHIVACNIRVTRWRDGGLSDDTTITPRIMVQATAAGEAVMLKILDACSGLTSENGDIPPDVLPVAIWFDSVGDLSNGLGYVSEDAYDNPLGKMTFRGARIDRATRAEWEAWRRQAAAAYVERGALPGPWGYDYPNNLDRNNPDIGKYVSACHGYRRLKLPEVIRGKIRPHWPQDRPRYWALANENDSMVGGLLNDATVTEPAGVEPWLKRFGTPGSGGGTGWSGVPIRSGRWVQRRPHVPSRWPTETYPLLWPPLVSAYPMIAPPPRGATDRYVHKLEFRGGAMNGFAACQNRKDAIGLAIESVDPDWKRKPQVFFVDDQRVRERTDGQLLMLAPQFIFERDEFVFSKFSTIL